MDILSSRYKFDDVIGSNLRILVRASRSITYLEGEGRVRGERGEGEERGGEGEGRGWEEREGEGRARRGESEGRGERGEGWGGEGWGGEDKTPSTEEVN